ncbi:dipeptide epimerase [Acidaminobacter sp. JC074]|uniref:mandelate racemase/muconate lactonizing enzyme family protein n=1 Tax=Acidaminobacter sp. JC074 TaxID=2530199 RepID=UPI001F0D179C|nr:dipeptide epimerase [Acidaminobacter sp. JC074]MCH4888903.1 dipeptide epimerase [Acidaminobacter sp. JC074]
MIIKDIKIGYLNIPLLKPFKTALRTVEHVQTIVVQIETDEGVWGVGDTAPSPKITGETQVSITEAILKHIKPNIVGMNIRDFSTILLKIQTSLVGNYLAKAAVDMALYDLRCKSFNLPMYEYLGSESNNLKTNKTIGIATTKEMIDASLLAVEEGFDALKIKVGLDSDQDLERLIAIRQAIGEQTEIRIDANQGWTVKEAIRNLDLYEQKGLKIELVEQPVVAKDILGLKKVKENTSIKVMADESICTTKDAFDVLSMEAADILNVKVIKNGGVNNALQIIKMAEVCNIECMIGCMLESRISISAAASIAMASKNVTKLDLDAPLFYNDDIIQGGVTYNKSVIIPCQANGLGIKKIKKISWISN